MALGRLQRYGGVGHFRCQEAQTERSCTREFVQSGHCLHLGNRHSFDEETSLRLLDIQNRSN